MNVIDNENDLLNRRQLNLNFNTKLESSESINHLYIINMKGILSLYYDSQTAKDIELVPDEIYLNNNASTNFSIEIDDKELEAINIWRSGRDLTLDF